MECRSRRTELRTCENFELVKMNEDGTAVLSLQNGTSMTVTPDAQGIATARIATGNSLFFAAR